MARPFQLALEECEEKILTDETSENNIDISDVIEESTESEEEVIENSEIDTQVDALEEASEEADAMLDQVDDNEQKIQDDEQGIQEVTDEDVVVSEENFKYSLIKFGYDDGLKGAYSLASEAKEHMYSNRKRLELTTESIGDFIAKVISAIKTLIKKIIISCKKVFAKVMFKFGKYEKRIKLLIKRAESINTNVNSAKLEEACKKYGKFKGSEVYYAVEHANYAASAPSKATIEQINKFEAVSEESINKIISGNKNEVEKKSFISEVLDKVKATFKVSKADNLDKFTSSKKPEDFDKSNILGIIGTKVYYIPKEVTGKLIKYWAASWKDPSGQEVILSKVKSVSAKDEVQKLKVLLKEVQNAKSVFKTFDDAQEKYLKYLNGLEDKLSKDGKVNQKSLKIGLDLLRVGAAEVNLYAVRKFIYDIKINVKLSNTYLTIYEAATE